MVNALREFRYFDFVKQRSVEVKAGQAVDPAVLGQNKVDVEKLARTRYIGMEVVGTVTSPKRGRPKKA